MFPGALGKVDKRPEMVNNQKRRHLSFRIVSYRSKKSLMYTYLCPDRPLSLELLENCIGKRLETFSFSCALRKVFKSQFISSTRVAMKIRCMSTFWKVTCTLFSSPGKRFRILSNFRKVFPEKEPSDLHRCRFSGKHVNHSGITSNPKILEKDGQKGSSEEDLDVSGCARKGRQTSRNGQ